jgi:hypothetical protein
MDGEMVTMYSMLYSMWSEYKTIETTFIILSITCKPFHAIKSRSIHGVTEDWYNNFKVYLLADHVSAEGQDKCAS